MVGRASSHAKTRVALACGCVHDGPVSDHEAPVLTVTFRDGMTSFLIGVGVIYWLTSSAMPFLTAALGSWATAPLFVLACAVGIAFSVWYASYSVQVGRDGVYLGRWRARRFIPASEIASVEERRSHKGVLEGLHIIMWRPSVHSDVAF